MLKEVASEEVEIVPLNYSFLLSVQVGLFFLVIELFVFLYAGYPLLRFKIANRLNF